MKKVKSFISNILYKPYIIFLLCVLFLFINLVLDGTLFRAFRLNRDLRVVQNRIEHIKDKNQDIQVKIKQASDSSFVEKEARERLDYMGDKDLIFVFPEEL